MDPALSSVRPESSPDHRPPVERANGACPRVSQSPTPAKAPRRRPISPNTGGTELPRAHSPQSIHHSKKHFTARSAALALLETNPTSSLACSGPIDPTEGIISSPTLTLSPSLGTATCQHPARQCSNPRPVRHQPAQPPTSPPKFPRTPIAQPVAPQHISLAIQLLTWGWSRHPRPSPGPQ
jgi:hypothetical protein